MEHPRLFDPDAPEPEEVRVVARASDPDTSDAAARSLESHVVRMERMVLRVIANRRAGMTTEEIADKVKMRRDSVSPRLRPLCRKGLVENSGELRKGTSGRNSTVWRATEAGLEYLLTPEPEQPEADTVASNRPHGWQERSAETIKRQTFIQNIAATLSFEEAEHLLLRRVNA